MFTIDVISNRQGGSLCVLTIYKIMIYNDMLLTFLKLYILNISVLFCGKL